MPDSTSLPPAEGQGFGYSPPKPLARLPKKLAFNPRREFRRQVTDARARHEAALKAWDGLVDEVKAETPKPKAPAILSQSFEQWEAARQVLHGEKQAPTSEDTKDVTPPAKTILESPPVPPKPAAKQAKKAAAPAPPEPPAPPAPAPSPAAVAPEREEYEDALPPPPPRERNDGESVVELPAGA